MTREEVYTMFHELDPELAVKLNTKGVVNILPGKLSKSILPKKHFLSKPVFEEKRQEGINVISYNESGARITKPKTQLISSGSRKPSLRSDRIDQKISDITNKIPTLEPVIGKILGNQVRQLMALFSQKILGSISILAGLGILGQIIFSKYAREVLVSWAKFSVLSGSFALLTGSLIGIAIKFIHDRIEEPKKSTESDQVHKIFKGIRQVKTRFKSKADKHGFFNPDLKMAS